MSEHFRCALFLFAFAALTVGCATAPQQAHQQHKPRQYECGPIGNKRSVLLPVPEATGSVVNVRLHGRQIPATYLTSGLTQFWAFDDTARLFIQLDPDAAGFTARYMDFRGAGADEKRKPTSVFFCELNQ